MSVLYVVTNWAEHFENNRTRELKNLAWVPMPNRHDGDGYTALLDHPKAASHYGAWCSIVQVASKCDPRGTLVRAGQKPHDSGSLSRITRIPKAVFDEAIPRLVEIGWLTCVTTEHESTSVNVAGRCGAGATAPHLLALNGMERTEGKEGNGMEGFCPETAEPSSEQQPVFSFPCDGKDSVWHLMPTQIDEWRELFPNLDVQAECRSALAWVKANPERRKTATGMRRFLVNWFTKSQNSGRTAAASTANNGKRPILGDLPDDAF